MEKVGLLKMLGIPDAFGGTLLLLFLILTLAPYLAGSDFGVFKIPNLSNSTKKRLKVVGPISLALAIMIHIPVFDSGLLNNVSLTNPFGENQVLLNGHKILITKSDSGKLLVKRDVNSYPKYLFQINKADPNLNLKTELISTLDYAKLIDKGSGFISLQHQINNNPGLRNGMVFRIYQDKPFNLVTTDTSYAGVKVDSKRYLEAKKFMGDPFKIIFDQLNKFRKEKDSIFNKLDTMRVPSPQDSLLKEMKSIFANQTVTIFNELVVVIVDRNDFELQAIAANGGTEVQASPFFYLLSFGNVLPYFDVKNVKDISISRNSKVWAFYAEQTFNNVMLNGEFQKIIHTDLYRIYAMNSSYIYQITVMYTPSEDTPRKTWDEFVELLQTLRIADN